MPKFFDTVNNRILRWESGASEGTVVAGGNGKGSALNQIHFPQDSHIDDNGDIYIADGYNNRVQRIQNSNNITVSKGSLTGSVTFSGIDDSIYETTETIILSPSTPVNGTLSSSDAVNISITDDDPKPTVSFALSSETINENSSTDVILTATLSAESEVTTTIDYSLTGTAESGEYTITDSPITIAAGATTGTVTISTNGLDDTDVEVTETIILTFGTLTNASTSTTDVTLNLTSDDLPSVT